MIDAVLFDLDGTLIDTAPDMGAALNNLLIEENREPLPLTTIRPLVSQGGLVLTRLGFEAHVEADDIEPLRQRFLTHYRAVVADNSSLFDGFDEIFCAVGTHHRHPDRLQCALGCPAHRHLPGIELVPFTAHGHKHQERCLGQYRQ